MSVPFDASSVTGAFQDHIADLDDKRQKALDAIQDIKQLLRGSTPKKGRKTCPALDSDADFDKPAQTVSEGLKATHELIVYYTAQINNAIMNTSIQVLPEPETAEGRAITAATATQSSEEESWVRKAVGKMRGQGAGEHMTKSIVMSPMQRLAQKAEAAKLKWADFLQYYRCHVEWQMLMQGMQFRVIDNLSFLYFVETDIIPILGENLDVQTEKVFDKLAVITQGYMRSATAMAARGQPPM